MQTWLDVITARKVSIRMMDLIVFDQARSGTTAGDRIYEIIPIAAVPHETTRSVEDGIPTEDRGNE